MIRNVSNSSDFWGKVVFTALFFFLIYAFQDQSYHSEKTDITMELVIESQLQNCNALINSQIKAPSFQKEALTDRERNFISPNNNDYKILADNHNIQTTLLALQKSNLMEKPQWIIPYYYHLFSGNSKDYPALS